MYIELKKKKSLKYTIKRFGHPVGRLHDLCVLFAQSPIIVKLYHVVRELIIFLVARFCKNVNGRKLSCLKMCCIYR